MNREEAKDRIHKYVGNGLSEAMRTVDMIYDHFEKHNKSLSLIAEEHEELINHLQLSREEIEKSKVRSCDNCKHFLQVAKNYPGRICSILNCSDIGGCGDYFEYRVNNES